MMSNPFGGSGSPQPGGFSATTSTVFGTSQQSVIGQSPGSDMATSVGGLIYGQNPSSNASGTNVFGQRSSPIASGFSNTFGTSTFGQNPVSSSTNLFGQSVGSSAFGQPSSSVTSAFGQPQSTVSNMFGQTSATSISTSFGAVTGQSNQSPSSSTGLLFSGQTKKEASSFRPVEGSFGQPHLSPSQALFGKTSSSSSFPAKISPVFGQSAGIFSGAKGTSSSPGEQSIQTSPFGVPSGIGQTNVFGGIGNSATLFGGSRSDTSQTREAGGGLFGKAPHESKSDTVLFAKRKPEDDAASSNTLFGKKSRHDPETGALIIKTEPQGHTDTKGVFGGKNMKSENPFGKISGFGAGDSQGLFGKPGSDFQAATLFGKPQKKEETSEDTDVKQERDYNESASIPSEISEERRGAARGLFGKSVAAIRSRLPSSQDYKDPGALVRTTMRRQLSSQLTRDTSKEVAIICKKVPPKYNNSRYLREHFKRFGDVKKVFPNQSKQQATVHFDTHESAAEAKRRGMVVARGVPPMAIFWSSYMSTGTPRAANIRRSSSGEIDSSGNHSLKRRSDESDPPKKRWSRSAGTDDPNNELASMAGTQDVQGAETKVGDKRRDIGGLFGKSRVRELNKLPEKKARSVSPTASTSVLDPKVEKIPASMFQGVTARNTTERVQLLELRDKYIRQNRGKKVTDIQKAVAFVGTCPDMCPEKERYDREDKRRLGFYEIIPGTENIPGKNPQVDHSRAVKEYARSSPDQDEPLPHELRPMPVLLSTMTFLLLEIADRGEDGRWGDWFDFLWNRTRGIRKDIIQQQLNDRFAVDLIEKCARFHVYCSERLCEEDMHSFDAKINDENLTKCLQTLREFYTDLEKKQKCYCENEAEFRAYTVLMNLNEGDILREVQQLRPEIRSSPSIRFALQAYFAVNNNNYIRFFRLVKQASYGNACIMHRYFTQVRNRAIKLMMRGYKQGSKPAQVSFNEFVRLLGFESEDEASEFCQHYGFPVSRSEVILDRAEYVEPETVWAPHRSPSLIESKLIVSVGEYMNGDSFNPNADHILPASSFDDQGKFYSHVELPKRAAEVVPSSYRPEVKVAPAPVEVKQEVAHEPPVLTEAQMEEQRALWKKMQNEYVKDTAKVIFWEVIDEMAQGIGIEIQTDIDEKLNVADDILEEIVSGTVLTEVKELSEEVYQESQIQKEAALRRELEQRIDRVATIVTDDIVFDLVGQEVLNLATIEIREVKAQLRRECIERVTLDISKDLVKEVAQEIANETSEDVFDTDVRQRLKQLEEFENLIKLGRTGKFWHRWKKEYKTITKIKRAMEEFPCAPNMQSLAEQVKTLVQVDDERITDKRFYVNTRARLTIETPVEIERRRREAGAQVTVHKLYNDLLYHTAWQSLDVAGVISKQLLRKHTRTAGKYSQKCPTVFWKLLLCLPGSDWNMTGATDDKTSKHLSHWLTAKLSKGSAPSAQQNVKGKVLSLYRCSTVDKSSTKSKAARLGVCVRMVEGCLNSDDISTMEEERLLLGTSALMMVLPPGASFDNPDSAYWQDQKSRLQSILAVRPMYQCLPLVVILPVSANQNVSYKQVKDCLLLDEHLEEESLSAIDLVTIEMDSRHPDGINVVDPRVSEQLCVALQWLAERYQKPPDLTVGYLRDLIDTTLLQRYYTLVQRNLKKRRLLGHLDQDPNTLLELYNNVVQHLGEVLSHEDLYNVSWPVTEFATSREQALPPSHWNKEEHLEYVYQLVQTLFLPEFIPLDDTSEDWSDVKRDLWTYISSVVGSKICGARIKLFSRLKKLLHQIEVDFEDTCFLLEGESQCEPAYVNVPWSNVVSMCIDYKLDVLDFTDPDSTSSLENCIEEMRVVFNKQELDRFMPPPEWKHVESDKSILDTPSVDVTIQRAVGKARETKAGPKMEISIVEDPNNITVVAEDTRKTSSSLINALKTERRQSDCFQKFLEDALKGGETDMDQSCGDQIMNVTSGTSFTSVFDRDRNQTFGAGNFTVTENQRRLSFDATGYFNQSQNDLSNIFDQTSREGRSLLTQPCRRKSDFGDMSTLPGKKRRERLSEIFDNDPVMIYINEPTLTEDMQNLRENITTNRRDSDLFERRLKQLLENH